MPQTRKRKTKEKVSDSSEKKERKESAFISDGNKKKNHGKPTSCKTKVTKSAINTRSKRKKCENLESSEEESNLKPKSKISKIKLSSLENNLLPWKDPKLGKARVVLHSLNLKKECDDSENLPFNNSTDSGFSSETSIDFYKTEFQLDFIKSKSNEQSKDEFSNSSESEWEEVEDQNCEPSLDDYKPDVLKEGVEITIDCPDLHARKRKKKKFNYNECIRLRINRMRKDIQLSIHKTHLLCLLAHGIYINKILNCDSLKAFALSLIPNDMLSYTSGRKIDKINISGIEKIVSWFCNSFTYEDEKSIFLNIFSSMARSFANKKSMNASEYNLMFIVFARILGFKVRFCVSLYPVTFKASNVIKKPKSKKSVPDASSNEKSKDEICEKEKYEPKSSKEQKCKLKKIKEPKIKKCKKGSHDESLDKTKENISRTRRSIKKIYKYSSDEEDNSNDKDFEIYDGKSDDDDKDFEICDDKSEDDDKDFEICDDDDLKDVKKISKSKGKPHTKQSNHKVLSLDSEPPSPEQSVLESGSIICWAEVYSKPNKQWVPIECSNKVINKPYDIEILAPQPVSYILAFDNESCVKDVTRRYCSEYMTSTIKLRVDPKWWEDSLAPFLPPNSVLNKTEEKKLDQMLVNKPLPTSVQGFKNHLLYALKIHLLKFEAIYPPDAPPVGFFRGEPVYARDCVHRLRTREKWFKQEARVVRTDEQPYKIVNAKCKWDRIACVIVKGDFPMEIFGMWQTEPYEPPIAVNGKVPRNEYGNVELFKSYMLPKGTVHLQLPGLNRIAKKLNIDCSPAVVGFARKRSILPKYDGFVICEEFKDKIIAAWNEEQENARKRQEEKREKRIYGNWKKLIKGLLIIQRIKLKYETK